MKKSEHNRLTALSVKSDTVLGNLLRDIETATNSSSSALGNGPGIQKLVNQRKRRRRGDEEATTTPSDNNHVATAVVSSTVLASVVDDCFYRLARTLELCGTQLYPSASLIAAKLNVALHSQIATASSVDLWECCAIFCTLFPSSAIELYRELLSSMMSRPDVSILDFKALFFSSCADDDADDHEEATIRVRQEKKLTAFNAMVMSVHGLIPEEVATRFSLRVSLDVVPFILSSASNMSATVVDYSGLYEMLTSIVLTSKPPVAVFNNAIVQVLKSTQTLVQRLSSRIQTEADGRQVSNLRMVARRLELCMTAVLHPQAVPFYKPLAQSVNFNANPPVAAAAALSQVPLTMTMNLSNPQPQHGVSTPTPAAAVAPAEVEHQNNKPLLHHATHPALSMPAEFATENDKTTAASTHAPPAVSSSVALSQTPIVGTIPTDKHDGSGTPIHAALRHSPKVTASCVVDTPDGKSFVMKATKGGGDGDVKEEEMMDELPEINLED